MGLFDKFKKEEAPVSTAAPTLNTQKVGLLNLEKNQVLDLSKTSAHYDSLRLSAGWDVVARGRDYDLDLFAVLLDGNDRLTRATNSCVYYGKKKADGIELDHDNLTGEGDGDDENVFINLTKVPQDVKKIVLAVAIYSAEARGQKFANVKNAYVRLVDTSNRREEEVCRYNLTEDGGNNTAVICAELIRNGSEWSFKAVGDYKRGSIESIKNMYA